MLSRPLLISVAVVLNIFHLFIPARIINYNFDPLLALLSFVTFLTIVFFTSSFKKDLVFIVLILVSFLSQLVNMFSYTGAIFGNYINQQFADA
jgi:hypothetical protein